MVGNPYALSIEPTTACNLGCPECPSGLKQFTRDQGNLKADFFTSMIDQMYEDLIYLTFYFQGEPYINPDFLDMVNYAHRKGIYTATSTNAHFLNEEAAIKTIESGLDKLIISLDGTTQETYEQYRIHGSIDKVISGTKEIVKWKRKMNSKTPKVVFQFLVVKPNEHQVEDAKKLAKELGVDEIKFKTAQVYDYENGNPLIPSIEKFSRYQQNADGKWTVKNEMLDRCWRMWHSAVITWDGLVVPCCFDKDAQHEFGKMQEGIEFSQIWNNPAYNQFRKSILTSRKSNEICKNCTEGTKVWT